MADTASLDLNSNPSLDSASEEAKLPPLLRDPSQSDPQPPESCSDYFQSLKDLRFDSVPLLTHSLRASLGSIEEMQQSVARYTKEVKVLSQHLPCETHGAAFVRVDEERMDLYRALLSGTEDTPYAHGLYLFDIACPSNYPNSPPKVRIATTGGGNVRFNPNLYSDGFVCLSIINTWDGDASERWNPVHSNLLQVLLSIQVLVMDKQVIQKEPDYEHITETAPENILYSNIVKYNNIKYAMIDMLRNPPSEFKEVIYQHFALKSQQILDTVDSWISEAEQTESLIDYKHIDYLVLEHNPMSCEFFSNEGYTSSLVLLRKELEQELNILSQKGVAPLYIPFPRQRAGGFNHALASVVGDSIQYNAVHQTLLSQIQDLRSSLFPVPVFFSSDESRLDMITLLVPGNIHSDYAYGLFYFHLACPPDFPASPPVLSIQTTALNSVNFASKLFKNGKVSLFNWTPANTLKDVVRYLISVLSENLVSSIDNYAPARVTAEAILRLSTIRYAMISMLVHPPEEFVSQVQDHFKSNLDAINAKIEVWMNESQMFNDVPYSDEVLSNPVVLNELREKGYFFLFQESSTNLLNELGSLRNPFVDMEVEELVEPEEIEPVPDSSVLVLKPETSTDPVAPDSNSPYFSALSAFRLSIELFDENTHSLYGSVSTPSQTPGARFTKEMQTLSKHLPCEAESSIFVVMGDDRMDLIQALISGPVDSPYAYGLYLFDIACPSDYPNSPPVVHIKTTGGGVSRFNPNLYSDGFVCLSVINTWSGNPEEMWNPGHSNLLQVLLSIQGLVMDKEVINKEPGYEHCSEDSNENKQYSLIVRINNLKFAILEMIKNPPPFFRNVVVSHFKSVKDEILKMTERWVEEADVGDLFGNIDPLVEDHNYSTCEIFLSEGVKQTFETVYEELKEVLNNL